MKNSDVRFQSIAVFLCVWVFRIGFFLFFYFYDDDMEKFLKFGQFGNARMLYSTAKILVI